MIAIYDPSENKVVLIGEKTYRISLPEFNKIRSILESQGLYLVNSISDESSLSVKADNLSSYRESDTELDEEKKYIASNKGKSVVVNGLEPKLQFMGIEDVKNINDLIAVYKAVPDAVQKLINSNVLVLLNDKEKAERLNINKGKKTIKGSRVKQSSGIEERMSAESSFDSDDDGDYSEDRILRNAVKIDL